MTPAEAAKILELPDHATPEQIEARFHELRTKLEDKIAKAPTPGLKAKYRESLDEITAAFETLALAADSSALPVLKREQGEGRGEQGATPEAGRPAALRTGPGAAATPPRGSEPGNPKSRIENQKSGKEFLIVALIAAVVLGAGGWWVMKTRAEKAEQARIAAEARVEAERKAAAEKAEAERKAAEEKRLAEEKRVADEAEKARLAAEAKAEAERRERELALLRSRLAQLNVQAEVLFVDEPTRAVRRLGELKADERALARDATPGALARARALLDAQQAYTDELEALIGRHPAKSTQAQAAELVSAKALEPASEAVELFATQLAKLDGLVTDAKRKLDGAIYGSVEVAVTSDGVAWEMTDAFGLKTTGGSGRVIPEVGIGTATVEFSRPGWPKQKQSVLVRRGSVARVAADFRPAKLSLVVQPAGATFSLSNGQKGRAPAEVEIVPGRVELSVTDPHHEPYKETFELGYGEQRTMNVQLKGLPLWNQEELDSLANGYTTAIGRYRYSASVLALGLSSDRVSAVVTSALPVSVSAAPFAPPPDDALKQPGESLRLEYYRPAAGGTWVNTGNLLRNESAVDVRIMARPDCDGLVLLSGMASPHASGSSLSWLVSLTVYGATNPGLVPLAQSWANSVRLNLAGQPPDMSLTYRVVIAIKFRRSH